MSLRVQAEPAFRDALLQEAVETMLNGDVETGKIILNYSTLQRLSEFGGYASPLPKAGNAS